MKEKITLRIFMAVPAALLALVPLAMSFNSEDGNIPGLGLEGAVFCGFWGLVLFLLLRKAWPFFAPYPSILIGALLVTKPKIAPVTHLWKGVRDPFPLFSETHLYFIVPGTILIIICFLFLLKSEEGK